MIVHNFDGGRIACAILSDSVAPKLYAQNFVKYIKDNSTKYEGDLKANGVVGPMTTDGTTQTFQYDLYDVDPACAHGPSFLHPNSCGIHIHSGTSCATNAGGHYFDNAVVGADPWKAVFYVSDSDGKTHGTRRVNTGYQSGSVTGHTLILHDYSGARIACAILSDGNTPTLEASAFVKYYDYNGDLSVGGSVGPFVTAGTTQSFGYALTGVGDGCDGGPGTAGNSCGIHIHAGMSCTENAEGHYWANSNEPDPWKHVNYTSEGGAASGYYSVDTGYSAADVAGHAFIVHNFEGKRIACAILGALTELPLSAAGFEPYFNYGGNLGVSGTVGPMTTNGGTQTFNYQLSGVDPECSGGAGTAGNSCGIHIHSGTSCAENALGHFYAVDDDPWTSVAYTSNDSGTAHGETMVDTGYSSVQTTGRAMIVHDYSGARIACAILGNGNDAVLQATAFVKYDGYAGALSVNGVVGPMKSEVTKATAGRRLSTQEPWAQDFEFQLSGVDPACAAGPGSEANSCGIHIHTGQSCFTPAGGHYWNEATIPDDPWKTVSYTSNSDGTTSGARTVVTGLTSGQVVSRAFIVHDFTGARIACALLGEWSMNPAPPPPAGPGCDGGCIAGAVVGAMAFVLIVIAVAVVLIGRKKDGASGTEMGPPKEKTVHKIAGDKRPRHPSQDALVSMHRNDTDRSSLDSVFGTPPIETPKQAQAVNPSAPEQV